MWKNLSFPYSIFNQASNWPKNGAKLTGMDVGEFTIYNAYLSSALFGLITITMVGGMESYPPPRVSRVKKKKKALAIKRESAGYATKRNGISCSGQKKGHFE